MTGSDADAAADGTNGESGAAGSLERRTGPGHPDGGRRAGDRRVDRRAAAAIGRRPLAGRAHRRLGPHRVRDGAQRLRAARASPPGLPVAARDPAATTAPGRGGPWSGGPVITDHAAESHHAALHRRRHLARIPGDRRRGPRGGRTILADRPPCDRVGARAAARRAARFAGSAMPAASQANIALLSGLLEHLPGPALRGDPGQTGRRAAARIGNWRPQLGASGRAATPRRSPTRAGSPWTDATRCSAGPSAGTGAEPQRRRLGHVRGARPRRALRQRPAMGDRRGNLRARALAGRVRGCAPRRREILATVSRRRHPDGSYWTGWQFANQMPYPRERSELDRRSRRPRGRRGGGLQLRRLHIPRERRPARPRRRVRLNRFKLSRFKPGGSSPAFQTSAGSAPGGSGPADTVT